MKRVLCLSLAVAITVGSAAGHWGTPTPTPVERIVRNIQAFTEENPDNAQGHYLLGRAHSLAFTLQAERIGLWSSRSDSTDDLPRIPDRSFQHNEATSRAIFWAPSEPMPRPLPLDVSIAHLKSSLRAFERAIELDQTRAECHLGYAYVVDQASHLAPLVDFVPGSAASQTPPEETATRARVAIQWAGFSSEWADGRSLKARAWLNEHRELVVAELLAHRAYPKSEVQAIVAAILKRYWRDIAADHYYTANTLGIKADQKIEEEPLRGLHSLVSYESGKSFERLVKLFEGEDGRVPLARASQLQTVGKNIAFLDAKPENYAITPIVLALDCRRSLREMLAETTTVEFDLDGDGIVELWPWVKPNTGFLVWDHDGSGTVTSGQQLFGSVTWWMFFDDGYAALDALDDNRDGWIREAERCGLAVWFDRNSNGISDAGEIRSLESHGIAALAVRATTIEEGCPAAPVGLVLEDGTALPTYDWITSPVLDHRR